MTGKEWVEIVSLITGCVTAVAAPFVGYVVLTLRRRVEETKTNIDEAKTKIAETKDQVEETKHEIKETKHEIKETKDKVTETIERLNGGVTLLLEETQARARAEGRAEAKAEAEIAAVELIRVNRIEWEKQTKDKAIADALVLKTATDKARMDEMEQALVTSQVLITSEARKALETSKAEAEKRAEKKASAPATPTTVLEAEPQNVELHVAETMTEVEKDAREKELAKKQEDEKK